MFDAVVMLIDGAGGDCLPFAFDDRAHFRGAGWKLGGVHEVLVERPVS